MEVGKTSAKQGRVLTQLFLNVLYAAGFLMGWKRVMDEPAVTA